MRSDTDEKRFKCYLWVSWLLQTPNVVFVELKLSKRWEEIWRWAQFGCNSWVKHFKKKRKPYIKGVVFCIYILIQLIYLKGTVHINEQHVTFHLPGQSKKKKKIGKLTQHQTVYSTMVQTAICKITTWKFTVQEENT